MSKFEVLKYNAIYMRWLGFRPYRFAEQTNEFFRSFLSYVVLLATICFVLSSIAYAFKYWPALEIMSVSCITALGGIQSVCMFFSFGMKMKKVMEVHMKLQKLVDDEDPNSKEFQMYHDVEEMCRQYTKAYGLVILLNVISLVGPLLHSFYCLITGVYDTSKWIVPFKFVVPFETQTIWKWYMEWIYGLISILAYTGSMGSLSAHFVSCCLYIQGICRHFELIIDSIQDDVRQNEIETKPSQYRMRSLEIKKKTCKLVETHINAVDVFNGAVGIYSGTIFWLILPNAIVLAFSMYNGEFGTFGFITGTYFFMTLFNSLAWPFPFCYFGNKTTERVMGIRDVIYNSNWYEFPRGMAKYPILIMALAQNPIHFTGLGFFYCTLEIYGQVVNSSYSYYMIFRGFTEH